MDLLQPEPKLVVEIAEAPLVVTPFPVEINRAVLSFLEHCPTSTVCFLITKHLKFAQTIRIDFVHSTVPFTGLVNIGAVLVN